jgi:hypothetical protein
MSGRTLDADPGILAYIMVADAAAAAQRVIEGSGEIVLPAGHCGGEDLSRSGGDHRAGVRWAAVEAVSRYHGTAIKSDYRRIAARRGRNIARVAAARKLLTIVTSPA